MCPRVVHSTNNTTVDCHMIRYYDISRVCYLASGGWLNAELFCVFSAPPLGIFCGEPGFFLLSFGGSIMGFFEKLYGITRIRPPERANLQFGNFSVRHTNSPHPLGSRRTNDIEITQPNPTARHILLSSQHIHHIQKYSQIGNQIHITSGVHSNHPQEYPICNTYPIL